MIAVVVLAALTSSTPPWCARALSADSARAPSAPAASAAFDALALALPKDAPVLARARDLAREDVVAATSMLRFAIDDACAPIPMPSAQELAARTGEIMKDARFTGVRKGDGAFDRFVHKIWLAIVSLLESQGMQQYAGSARVIFLSVLAVVASLLSLLVGRALLRQRRADVAQRVGDRPAELGMEAHRQRAYAALRADATRLLAAGQARAALRAGDAALLARVGALDDARASAAVTPARTHREIVAKLPGPIADVVRPPFVSFDALFFGRSSLAIEDARVFLAEVDAAEQRLPNSNTPGSR